MLTSTVSGSCTSGQAEVGTYATSYIPTAGTSVTRGADLATIDSSQVLIGTQDLTILYNFTHDGSNDVRHTMYVDASNRWSLSYSNSSMEIYMIVGGVLFQHAKFNYTFNAGSSYKVAFSMVNGTSNEVAVNGVIQSLTIDITTGGDLNVTSDFMVFRYGNSVDVRGGGSISLFAIGHTPYTSTQLTQLTTL